ncbi:MAG: hypothetical protein GW827_02765 [Flavobacteriales bacterium]|nr:hypothetical protein [Flavobacteriales bacterium]
MFVTLDLPIMRWAALATGLFLVIPWHVDGLFTHGLLLFSGSLCIAYALMPMVIRFAHAIISNNTIYFFIENECFTVKIFIVE